MFDDYIPVPSLNCPACGALLRDWQGKDGPNALLVWQQGIPLPVEQRIEDDDIRLAPEQLVELRLPEEFLIYTTCCGEGFFLKALCQTRDETWTQTVLITAETAKQGKNETRGKFRARLRWLEGEAQSR